MNKLSSAAFSLIEIIIVVGVLATITGVILVSYNNFNTNQKLKQAAKTLKSDLRFVQTRSYSGLKPQGVACTTLTGYQVSFTLTSYTFQPLCSPQGAVSPATTINLPDQVSFSAIPPTFYFLVLKGVASADVTMSLTTGANPIQVQVSRSGDINEL